ncbi:MAG: DUF4432 family protein [Lachnospiraceae bacterium]|nr:DUF4432 family protein [Lachnospiraceae bacterium]
MIYETEPGINPIKLENEKLRVIILPHMGGRIISLFHKEKSFEAAAQPGESAGSTEAGTLGEKRNFAPYAYGMDEAFPNIDEEDFTWRGHTRHYPDHGEIWQGLCRIREQGKNCVELVWSSPAFDYCYEKKLCLKADSLHIHYRITNRGKEELPAVWTWHGLMRYEEDMEIVLPQGAQRFRNVLDSSVLGKEGDVYPLNNGNYDFTKVPRAESRCAVKYYVESRIAEGRCGFYYPSAGMSCMLEYDADKLPYLGVWITAGGFQGDYNCALEPANGFYDSVSRAAGNGKLPILGAGESMEFELVITLADALSSRIRERSFPTWGNAFRINDQSRTQYPLTLIVHDTEHLELVTEAEGIFSGKYPLGYVGTSPWPGVVTNSKTMHYTESQNGRLYDLLREQMEIGWVIYGLSGEKEEESELSAMIRDMTEKCPGTKQFWMRKKGEPVSHGISDILTKYGVLPMEYDSQAELGKWLERLTEEIDRARPPVRFDRLDREDAEWTNLSVTLPEEETDNRILLAGDSISAGYGDMVQKLMPGWHVDRLNTSEGIHHPNFLRLLEIGLERYPYRIVHINNGIHLHGQSVEQYGWNLSRVFEGIRRIAPKAEIIFATTTPLSRNLSGDELEEFQAEHFSMGDRAPLALHTESGEYWVTDEKASEIYRRLNEEAKRVCMAREIRVNDLYRLCVDENLQKSDGVHFQEEAYQRLAARIAEVLQGQ